MKKIIFLSILMVLFLKCFPQGFECGTSTVTDIDGYVYHTVLMGGRCWTKENMRTTRYASGDPVGIYEPPAGTRELVNTPGLLKIGMKLESAERIPLEIFSVKGERVFSETVSCTAGDNTIAITLGPRGVYLVCFQADGLKSSFLATGTDDARFAVASSERGTLKASAKNGWPPDPRRYYDYNNDPANDEKFGKLYTAVSALNADVYNNPSSLLNVLQGICPNGWHVSNDTDWMFLEHYKGMSWDDIGLIFANVRGYVGRTLLTSDTTYWIDACGTGKNEFDGRGGGHYQGNGKFTLLKDNASWITYSPEFGPMLREIKVCGLSIYRTTIQWQNMGDAYSVRCVKDD